LTGSYAHNTQTYNNTKNGGCYGQNWINNHELNTFPKKLQDSGYETFYAGKYLNEYKTDQVPPGYNQFYGLLGNSRYFNYTLNENGNLRAYGEDEEDYLTNVIRNKSLEFVKKQSNSKPFFAMLSLPSCHAPFTPESKYVDKFKNVKAPRTKNFNIGAEPSKKHWLMTMEPRTLPDDVIETIDDIYRRRLQTLLTVDDLIEDLIEQLSNQNLIQNTFIIFTSDNGYHLGQFAMPWDKRLPYETDIGIPLIIRGPNVPYGITLNSPVLLIDIAPTILNWAKISFDANEYDGKPFDHLLTNAKVDHSLIEERQMLIEYWGEGNYETYNENCPYKKSQRLDLCLPEAACKCQDSWNNTYSCVRHMSPETNMIFCMFKDRENYQEAYDLNADFHQLDNIGFDLLPSIQGRYQIIIEDLEKCKGESCRINKPI
jgi:N-acetylglucosamine-6-sulfatase